MQNLWKRSGSAGKGQTFAQAGSKQRKKLRTASLRTGSQHPDWLFADTLGMLCPFACRYGVQKQDKELLNLGIRQLELFFQKGMDEKTGLPYHGYDEKNGMKYGIIGWGRACGWMLLGLSQSLLWISEQPAGAEQADKLQAEQPAAQPSSQSVAREGCNRLLLLQQQLLDSIFVWQRADGGFSWQLQAQEGHRDTSAEGMIGYGAWLAEETAAVQRSEQWSPALSRLAATCRQVSKKDMSQTAPGNAGALRNIRRYTEPIPGAAVAHWPFWQCSFSGKRITIGQKDPYALSQDNFDQTVWQEYQENRTKKHGKSQ